MQKGQIDYLGKITLLCVLISNTAIETISWTKLDRCFSFSLSPPNRISQQHSWKTFGKNRVSGSGGVWCWELQKHKLALHVKITAAQEKMVQYISLRAQKDFSGSQEWCRSGENAAVFWSDKIFWLKRFIPLISVPIPKDSIPWLQKTTIPWVSTYETGLLIWHCLAYNHNELYTNVNSSSQRETEARKSKPLPNC